MKTVYYSWRRRNWSSVPAHYYDVGAYLKNEVSEMGIFHGIVLSIIWRKEVLLLRVRGLDWVSAIFYLG